jgi:hypothetical protein
MTRYEKITVSLSSRAAENARRAVRHGQAPSVSAYVTAAIEEKSKREDLLAMLYQMLDETGGPPTAAERRAVRRELGLPARKKPRARKRPR